MNYKDVLATGREESLPRRETIEPDPIEYYTDDVPAVCCGCWDNSMDSAWWD